MHDITMIDNASKAEQAAEDYFKKGWNPFPLPAGLKSPPPPNITGRFARPSEFQLRELWESEGYNGNLGLKLQTADDDEYDIMGVDIDTYDDKDGWSTYQKIAEQIGPLPLDKAPFSTRRGVEANSGQYFFRVKKGTHLNGKLGDDIDIIQPGHRYTAAFPSVVDDLEYKWYLNGEETDIPRLEDIPLFPEEYLEIAVNPSARGDVEPVEPIDISEALEWIRENTPNDTAELESHSVFAEDLKNPEIFAHNAHDVAFGVVSRWVRDAAQYGAQNVLSALETLGGMFVEELGKPGRGRNLSAPEAEREFLRMVRDSVNYARAEVEARMWSPWVKSTRQIDYFSPESRERIAEAGRNVAEALKDGRWRRLGPEPAPEGDTPAEATEGSEPARKKTGLVLRSFSEIETKETTWLWEYDGLGGIPINGMTIFTGKGEVGKSTACRWLAAGITRGTVPGEFYGVPQGVLYVAAEEDNGAMVKPSLLAHGADEQRVFFTEIDGESNRVDPGYMAQLTELCLENDIKLIVVDPMSNYLHGADMNKASDVRAALRPWTRLAEDIGGSVVSIFHQNKSGSTDTVYGVGGSAAIPQIARTVFAFARDDETGDCVMSQGKNNLGQKIPHLSYVIASVQLEGMKRPVGKFVLGGVSDRVCCTDR